MLRRCGSYRDLVVWQTAMLLVREVHRLTRLLPPEERYCLAAQLRRSAISIPSNIAEGSGRQRRRDYARFLLMARGSVQELETQLLIAVALDYLSEAAIAEAERLTGEISRMLSGLVRSLARLGV